MRITAKSSTGCSGGSNSARRGGTSPSNTVLGEPVTTGWCAGNGMELGCASFKRFRHWPPRKTKSTGTAPLWTVRTSVPTAAPRVHASTLPRRMHARPLMGNGWVIRAVDAPARSTCAWTARRGCCQSCSVQDKPAMGRTTCYPCWTPSGSPASVLVVPANMFPSCVWIGRTVRRSTADCSESGARPACAPNAKMLESGI